MDLRNRHTLVEGCNWLMVGVALGWIVYMFAGLFSSPTDSQTIWSPTPVIQRALPAKVEPTPTWGPENRVTRESNQATGPGRTAASNSGGSLTEAAPPPDPTTLWGDAPYVVAPEGKVPPITPVHPLLGPDF